MKTHTLAILLSLGLISASRAATFFGDISGNQLFSGYGLGPGGGINNAIAEGFTMTQTISLTSVDIYLSNFQPAAGSNLALSIFSDVGNKPGVDLYDLSTDISIATSGTPALVTLSGSGSFTLTSGTHYWLDLYATNPASTTGNTVEWDNVLNGSFGQVNPTGSGATDNGQLRSIGSGNTFSGSPSTTEQRTSFQLNSVPEPGCAGFLTLGSAVLTLSRRRRQPF